MPFPALRALLHSVSGWRRNCILEYFGGNCCHLSISFVEFFSVEIQETERSPLLRKAKRLNSILRCNSLPHSVCDGCPTVETVIISLIESGSNTDTPNPFDGECSSISVTQQRSELNTSWNCDKPFTHADSCSNSRRGERAQKLLSTRIGLRVASHHLRIVANDDTMTQYFEILQLSVGNL